jgi:hypothetical protein
MKSVPLGVVMLVAEVAPVATHGVWLLLMTKTCLCPMNNFHGLKMQILQVL